jgi:hypothetical protein
MKSRSPIKLLASAAGALAILMSTFSAQLVLADDLNPQPLPPRSDTDLMPQPPVLF